MKKEKIRFKIEYDMKEDEYILYLWDEEEQEWGVMDRNPFKFVLKFYARIYALITKYNRKRSRKAEEFEL